MKILILSDLHLDQPKGDLRRFDLEDPITAIRSLRDYTKGIEAVIIAGDIFDSVRIDSTALHLMKELNEELKSIPLKFSIRGNHDRSRFSILEDVFGFTSLSGEKNIRVPGDITLSGCDYTDIDAHRKYLNEATSDILVCHFPMSPFSSFGEGNISVSECPENKVVIVGDTHKQDAYLQGDRCIVSPGCLFPANKTEILSNACGTGFIMTIYKEDGVLTVSLHPIRLKTRFGASLIAITDKDELLQGLKTIEMRGPFPGNLEPVAYINACLSDVQYPGITLIPVAEASDESPAVVEFGGLSGEGIPERTHKILSTLFEKEEDKDKLIETTEELLSTDAPEELIRDFIAR